MNIIKYLSTIIALSTISIGAYANDDKIAQGKAKSATCAACHGSNGIATIPMYPNLAGQNTTYLINAMKAYRDKNRSGGMAGIMTPMVANLSDTDIENLAHYYNSLANK